jgi:hypothetical protein
MAMAAPGPPPADSTLFLAGLVGNMRTCIDQRRSGDRKEAGNQRHIISDGAGGRFICPRGTDCEKHPHIHVYPGGAGWPGGNDNIVIDATPADEAFPKVLSKWKTQGQGFAPQQNLIRDRWAGAIDCAVNQAKQDISYTDPLTYPEYIREAELHTTAVIREAVTIDGTFDRSAYDELAGRGMLLQSLVNLSLITAGGEGLVPPRLSISTPVLRRAKMAMFYNHLANLMIVAKERYAAIDDYCRRSRNLNKDQKARLLGNITQKLTKESDKLRTEKASLEPALLRLRSIRTPKELDPICISEGGGGPHRRTRRKNGRRRTQKKRKTYV